jgi:hypothetical protein
MLLMFLLHFISDVSYNKTKSEKQTLVNCILSITQVLMGSGYGVERHIISVISSLSVLLVEETRVS